MIAGFAVTAGLRAFGVIAALFILAGGRIVVVVARRALRDESDRLWRRVAGIAEDPVVGVIAVACREWLPHAQSVGALPVGSALRAEEERAVVLLAEEAVGEVEEVGDEEDLDPAFEHGSDQLAGDLRAFSFVRRRERLVAQEE